MTELSASMKQELKKAQDSLSPNRLDHLIKSVELSSIQSEEDLVAYLQKGVRS